MQVHCKKTSPKPPSAQLAMDPYSNSPAHMDFSQSLRDVGDYPMGEYQCDYPVTDAFALQLEPDEGLPRVLGPDSSSIRVPFAHREHVQDHHWVASPTWVPVQSIATHHLSRSSISIPPPIMSPESVRNCEVPRRSGSLQSMETPRSDPVRRNTWVCPTPTSMPCALAVIPLSTHPIETITENSRVEDPSFLRVSDRHNQLTFLSCDHLVCAPPPDVGVLSQRFPENEQWIRGRALARGPTAPMRPGISSLPIEVLEMIPEYFPVVDQLTSLGFGEAIFRTWNRHKAYMVLSATSQRLRRIFYVRSCTTRITSRKDLPTMVRLLKTVEVTKHTLFIERLITQIPNGCTEIFRDCLLSLPALDTLGIVDTDDIGTKALKATFKYKPDFPTITKVAIPAAAHPILTRLPNVEEIVCYSKSPLRGHAKRFFKSLRGPYSKERQGKIEPVLKSLTIVCPTGQWGFSELLVKKLPRLRKISLPEPTEEDMAHLRDLKEIIELEIVITSVTTTRINYDCDAIKAMGVQILQASGCHNDCLCGYKCECSRTGECYKCKPPKRILRIKSCSEGGYGQSGVYLEPGLEEILVSPRRILSKK